MSCRRQFLFQMPQVRVATNLWLDGTAEQILDTSQTNNESHYEMSHARVHCGGNQCQTDRRNPAHYVSESLGHQSFFTVSSHDPGFAEPVEVCEKGSRSEYGSVCFQDSCLTCTRCLHVWFLTFHNHQQEYRPLNLKWTEERQAQAGREPTTERWRGNVEF